MGDKYQELGVSASKTGVHSALKEAGISEGAGLFAAVSKDLAGSNDHFSMLHADGAGTKTIVGYLAYREFKDSAAFGSLAQDALVMNLDDMYCIGAPEQLLLSNTVGRNARLIGDDALAALLTRYRELCELFCAHGVPIEMAGGETADCGDVVRTAVVDATVAGRIRKDAIIDANRIVPGDVIVGLSSTGQASYETKENSSIASNGLTLARHSLLSHSYVDEYPEIVDPAIASDAAYRGPFRMGDTPEGLGMSVGEALLSPTRTFAPVLTKIYAALQQQVHGVINITGGGATKVLRFGNGNRYVKNNLFPTPPLFSLIQQHGEVSWREMYQVFNMGQRMELYVPSECAEEVISLAKGFSIDAQQIGVVEKGS